MDTQFYKKAHGCIIVFDLMDNESIKGTKRWLQSIEKIAKKDCPKVLCGTSVNSLQNATDPQLDREAKEIASACKMEYFKTSVLDG